MCSVVYFVFRFSEQLTITIQIACCLPFNIPTLLIVKITVFGFNVVLYGSVQGLFFM